MNDVTLDGIIEWMKVQVENKNPIAASTWLDAAAKLNLLLLDLDDLLVDAEMEVNKLTHEFLLVPGATVASSKTAVRSSDAYGKLLKLKAKKERVTEFIRLAKKRTELQAWDV